jgi:ABC-2 type transport system ATP-binding protein
VFLNGSLLGFSRKEMEKMYDDIVEFAELEKFMDQKLKNYSSGMQVRLAFSIAIQAKSDILLLDEVLAVGDGAFQKKCYQYFAEIRRQKQTVVLVTHDMDAIQQFCTKAALVDKGHKTVIDSPLKITQIYRELNDQDGVTVNKINNNNSETSTKYVSAQMKHTKSDGKITFDINLKPKAEIDDPIVAMGIYRETGEQVYRWTSDEKIPFKLDLNTHKQVKIEVADIFPVGIFTVNLFIKKRDRTMDYATFNEIAKFEIKNLTPRKFAVFWKIPERTLVNGKELEDVH